MTLPDIAQIVGLIGTPISLIYVAIQIRNNARAAQAATYHNLSLSISGTWFDLAQSDELCSLILRGSDDFTSLNRVEKARYRFMIQAYMSRFENAWFQYKIGTLKEGDWQAIAANMRALYSTPGARAAWPVIKNRTGPDFRNYIDSIVEQGAAAEADTESSD